MHWAGLAYVGIAAVLSMVIGAEREFFAKPAGMRTTALVGMGAAAFTVISREGLWLMPGMVATNADGSRVAAQIVSGIGFLGAGLIFVRRDDVRGLTTAAGMWFVASVGMAAGSGLIDIAVFLTAVYLLITLGVRPISHRLPKSKSLPREIEVTYDDGHGLLRLIMERIGERGVVVLGLHVTSGSASKDAARSGRQAAQTVVIKVQGTGQAMQELTALLRDVEGVHEVHWRTNAGDD